MNSTVRSPRWSRCVAASATASRSSFTPDSTADSVTKRAPASVAITRASVVLPVPGGPHRISDGSSFASSARRSSFPGPSSCSCPTNSASDVGRIRSASGCPRRSFAAARANRSTGAV